MKEQILLMLSIIAAKKPPLCCCYLRRTEDVSEKLLFRNEFIHIFFISLLYKVLKNHKFACGLGSVVLFLNHLLVSVRVLFSKVWLRNKIAYDGNVLLILLEFRLRCFSGGKWVEEKHFPTFLYADNKFKCILTIAFKLRLYNKKGLIYAS
jgi:hypothetical protein